MITQTTIDNLSKKANGNYNQKAAVRLQHYYKLYQDEVAESKKIKPGEGYQTSSERDAYSKRRFRNEDTIKTFKRFLTQVGWNKSSPAIYLYIMNGPTGSVDYYHGQTTPFMPFSGSEWKRRIVTNAFKSKLS